MTKTATLIAAALLALASLTVAHASIPPRDLPAGEAQTAAKSQPQTSDKVALVPRSCGECCARGACSRLMDALQLRVWLLTTIRRKAPGGRSMGLQVNAKCRFNIWWRSDRISR